MKPRMTPQYYSFTMAKKRYYTSNPNARHSLWVKQVVGVTGADVGGLKLGAATGLVVGVDSVAGGRVKEASGQSSNGMAKSP